MLFKNRTYKFYHPNKRVYNYLAYNCGEKFIIKYSKFFKGSAVDLGSGSSPYKKFILTKVLNYTSVDWSNCLHDNKFDIVADLNLALPIKDNSFDTILSFSTLEHLSEPQLHLKEAYRICKKNGVIFIQIPFNWQLHEQPYDYFRYTEFGIKKLLQNAGFKGIKVEAQCGLFTTLALKLNYFLTRFIKGPELLKGFVFFIFRPIWITTQTLAPILDNLDRNWTTETSFYSVIGFKE